MEIELFPRVCEAVEAMEACCGQYGTPIARSEVYNETWLLRMVLSCLHDYKGDFNASCPKEEREILNRIRDAVRVRWISEGGLRPTLKNEGTTWTDAIIGAVGIKDDVDDELDSETKRGIVLNRENKNVGVVVIEAKVGSKLSKGTRNYPEYNQAARNIACLAQLVMDDRCDLVDKCSFVVLGPREHIKSWEGLIDNQKRVGNALDVIKAHLTHRRTDDDRFVSVASIIASNSMAISWESIIDALVNQRLRDFYDSVIEENQNG